MSKLFCLALLLGSVAGCKDKPADPPKSEPAAKPSPDPSPAARKAEAPKPTPDPSAGSGSGSGSGKAEPQTVDTTIKRQPDKPGADRQPGSALVDKLKKKMDAKADAPKK